MREAVAKSRTFGGSAQTVVAGLAAAGEDEVARDLVAAAEAVVRVDARARTYTARAFVRQNLSKEKRDAGARR